MNPLLQPFLACSRMLAITYSMLLVTGCVNTPDIARAEHRLHNGEVKKGREELLRLIAYDHPTAKILMVEQYLDDETVESFQQAEALLSTLPAEDEAVQKWRARLNQHKYEAGLITFDAWMDAYKVSGYLNSVSHLTLLIEAYLNHPENISQHVPIKEWMDRKLALGDISAKYDMARFAFISGAMNLASETERPEQEFDANLHNDVQSIVVKNCSPVANEIPACYALLLQVQVSFHNTHQVEYWLGEVKKAYAEGKLKESEVYTVAKSIERLPFDAPSLENNNLSYKTALNLYRILESDSPRARVNIARLKLSNNRLIMDGPDFKTLMSESENGNVTADYILGRMYFSGKVVTQDPIKAMEHFNKCIDTYPAAKYYLGKIHYLGLLGEQDYAKALTYLLQAARGGFEQSYRFLAKMYSEGKGINRNNQYAYVFSRMALEGGDTKSLEILEDTRAQLNESQLLKAHSLYLKERNQMANVLGKDNSELQNAGVDTL